jgi:hypothetical protein
VNDISVLAFQADSIQQCEGGVNMSRLRIVPALQAEEKVSEEFGFLRAQIQELTRLENRTKLEEERLVELRMKLEKLNSKE